MATPHIFFTVTHHCLYTVNVSVCVRAQVSFLGTSSEPLSAPACDMWSPGISHEHHNHKHASPRRVCVRKECARSKEKETGAVNHATLMLERHGFRFVCSVSFLTHAMTTATNHSSSRELSGDRIFLCFHFSLIDTFKTVTTTSCGRAHWISSWLKKIKTRTELHYTMKMHSLTVRKTGIPDLYISLCWSNRAREQLDYATLYCCYTNRWWGSTALWLVRNHERVELNYSRELRPLW